jgi:hypothetical protein
MKVIRQKHVGENWWPSALVFTSFMLLGMSRVAAQPESAAPDDQPSGAVDPVEEIAVDEEITVVGQRSLGQLRLEVQLARERVYGLFNSLNSDDEFDIHCRNAPRTGTRIPRRVCRPQYANDATSEAGSEFVLTRLLNCYRLSAEACLGLASARAAVPVSLVPVKDRQLAEEVERVARENAEFRQAIAGFQVVERRYDDARRAEGMELRVSTSIIDSVGAAIPSSLGVLQDEVVFPEAIELVTPDALWSGLEEGEAREGWVKLRYSVLADGTTADVHVVDAMPPGLDPLSAMLAAHAWTFEPAMADGVPIDWHNNHAIIVFNREQTAHAAWPQFAATYEEVADLIARGEYGEARSRNERMRRELAVTLEEMAFGQMQLAVIEHASGDAHAALDAIRRATEPTVERLGDEELELALEHRFALELELGRAADALTTYERGLELGRVPSSERLARLGESLERTLAAPEANLAARGRIGSNEQWDHSLTWPIFAIGDVDGRVEGLQLVCNRGKATLPLEEDVQMAIPAGWGECALFVDGQPETTFVVYESKELVN